MSLSLNQTKTALIPNLTASFLAAGGVEPYVYSVLPGGAGGSIDPDTGLYTAPSSVQEDPSKLYDTIQVTDANDDTATATILVGTPLLLFCEIIQREMGLADGRVMLWDQKKFQPTDSGLYIAVSVQSERPFGNTIRPSSSGWGESVQALNVLATLNLDIISRGPSARDRKEEVLLAVNSIYSQFQQEANSFSIGKLPAGSRFVNLSQVDGAAIPYRFQIAVNVQYTVTKQKPVDYFDEFQDVQVTTQP